MRGTDLGYTDPMVDLDPRLRIHALLKNDDSTADITVENARLIEQGKKASQGIDPGAHLGDALPVRLLGSDGWHRGLGPPLQHAHHEAARLRVAGDDAQCVIKNRGVDDWLTATALGGGTTDVLSRT